MQSFLAKYDCNSTREVKDVFSEKGIEWLKNSIELSWIDRMAVDSFLDWKCHCSVETNWFIYFTSKIASRFSKDKTILEQGKAHHDNSGDIDYITALTVISEIIDIKRFKTPWKLVAYAGLFAPSLKKGFWRDT
jgi:hypothetical protein